MEESLESLREALRKKDAVIEKLKEALVLFRQNSVQYQACIREHEEKAALEISSAEKAFRAKEAKLLRRCEEAEACVARLSQSEGLRPQDQSTTVAVPAVQQVELAVPAAAGPSQQASSQLHAAGSCLRCEGLHEGIVLLREQMTALQALSQHYKPTSPPGHSHSHLDGTLHAILDHLSRSAKEQSLLREEHNQLRRTVSAFAPAEQGDDQEHSHAPAQRIMQEVTAARTGPHSALHQNSQESGMAAISANLLKPVVRQDATGQRPVTEGREASCEAVTADEARQIRRPHKRLANVAFALVAHKQPRSGSRHDKPAQQPSSRDVKTSVDHEQGLTAVDVAQHWLDRLTHTYDAVGSSLVQEVAEGLHHAILMRQCPVRCIAAGTVSAIIDCAALPGFQSGALKALSDGSVSSRVQDQHNEAISLHAGARLEDLAFCGAWYEEQPRARCTITLLLMCMMRLQSLLDGKASRRAVGDAVEDVLQELHKELRRCLSMKDKDKKRSSYSETENCAVCASLALLCRITGNIQAMRILVWDLTLVRKTWGVQALPPLTAALTVWPEALTAHGHCNERSSLVQAEIQDLCRQALASTGELRDEATINSLSTTTTSATMSCATKTAAFLLHRLGCDYWLDPKNDQGRRG